MQLTEGKSPCQLQFLENPSRGDLSDGLLWTSNLEEPCKLQDSWYLCCNGTGECEVPSNQLCPSIQRCKLHQRLARVNKLRQQFSLSCPESPWPEMKASRGRQLLSEIGHRLKNNAPAASLTRLANPNKSQSELWWLALGLIWRLGITTVVLDGKKGWHLDSLGFNGHKGPIALVAIGVEKYHQTRYAEQIESLIGFAYSSRCLLWLEIKPPKQGATRSEYQSPIAAYYRKKAAPKAHTPWNHLTPHLSSSTRSQLHSLINLPRSI